MSKIKFRKLTKAEIASCNGRYKYELTESYCRIKVDLGKVDVVVTGWIVYHTATSVLKTIWINKGYWWDGPSGPTFDTPDFMPSSLVHDAGYQLVREGKLSRKYRKYLDKLLVQMCKEDGMAWWRRFYVYHSVRLLGWRNLKPEKTRQSSPL